MPNPAYSPKHSSASLPCKVAVIWIDWYAYHLARFRGLLSAPSLAGRVCGIELVGGVGVHAGLKFREDLPPDLPIHTLMPESSWAAAGQLRLAWKLWRHLSSLNPQVVLVPGYYTLPALAAALWARFHSRQSVLMTESTAGDHARVAWKEWLKSLLIRALFDSAVTGGRAHRRYLEQLGFPPGRIAGFYDVVDNAQLSERVSELRKQSSSDHALPETYFLYVGRLSAEKNVRSLLNAWLAYRETGGSWPLILVGDGPEAPALRGLAAGTPFAADVFFAGHKGSRDLPPFYAHAGCFVLPSSREPWGLVVNEAMAAGLPVLISDRCGCVEDLVDPPRNGLTFDPSSEGDLLRCLHRIGSASTETLASMGTLSAERIALFSPQNFGIEIARLTEFGTAAAHPSLTSSNDQRKSSVTPCN